MSRKNRKKFSIQTEAPAQEPVVVINNTGVSTDISTSESHTVIEFPEPPARSPALPAEVSVSTTPPEPEAKDGILKIVKNKLVDFPTKNKNSKSSSEVAHSAIKRDNERLKKSVTKKEAKKEKRPIPRTTVQTIPYLKMTEHDITVIEKGFYSKTWEFSDINYSIMKQDEQEDIFIQYGKILNYFSSDIGVQINIVNQDMNLEKFKENVLYRYTDDDPLKPFKADYNDMLNGYMSQKENTIIRRKYITLSIRRDNDLEHVNQEFKVLEEALVANFRVINSNIRLVTNYEKVTLLKNIFRGIDVAIPDSFSEQDYRKQLEKNFISPDYFSFKNNYFMFNDKYARVLRLRDLPSFLGDNLVSNISEIDSSMCISIHIRAVLPEVAIKMVNRQLTSIEADKIKHVKRAIRNKLPPDILPRDMELSLEDGREIYRDLTTKNENIVICQGGK